MPRRPLIDFYLYASHEVDTFLPIVQALRARDASAEFVLEPPGRNLARGSRPDPETGWHDDKVGNLGPLLDRETYLQLQRSLRAAGEIPRRRRRRRATGVTTQGCRWMRVYSGARIRVMYGVGFDEEAYGHGVINRGFDLVLAHGAFSASAIHRHVDVPIAEVGYPKWARYRRGDVDQVGARRRLGIPERGRPVVAWLPTWAQHSSLDAYGPAVAELTGAYQVLLKPHHNNLRFEQSRLEGLQSKGMQLLAATDSLVDVIVAADVVLADTRSGALTEAILADRPVVALGLSGDASLHAGVTECAVRCADPAALKTAVAVATAQDHADARRAWATELFGYHAGRDDDVAARAILEVTDAPVRRRRRFEAALLSTAYTAARRMGR